MTNNPPVNPARIAALAAQGLNKSQVAAALGCCRKTIIKATAKHGIQWHAVAGLRKPLFSDQALRAALAAGDTVAGFAARHGLSCDSVRRRMRRAGISAREFPKAPQPAPAIVAMPQPRPVVRAPVRPEPAPVEPEPVAHPFLTTERVAVLLQVPFTKTVDSAKDWGKPITAVQQWWHRVRADSIAAVLRRERA